MTARTDRNNRVGLLLLGLLLLLAGAAAIATGLGLFGSRVADQPVVTSSITNFLSDYGVWVAIALIIIGVILALIGLRWLVSQLRVERLGEIQLEPDHSRGVTTMSPRVLTDALCAEVQGIRGVDSASAHMGRHPDDPELNLTVGVNKGADVAAVRREVEGTALAHAREALGRDRLRTILKVEASSSSDDARQLR
ncbi:hypothetical protein BH24ACT13_BH24ACT13_07350 [soil metagenome]